MARKKKSSRNGRRKRVDRIGDPRTDKPNAEYRVGPGRPPKEYQFKPGQSGNPKGAKRKTTSLTPDVKALFKRALNIKVTLKQGESEQTVTMVAAGIQQLVSQFAKGDRHARRDLIILADKLGVDLTAGHSEMLGKSLEDAISEHDQVLLDDFVKHRGKQYLDAEKAENPESEENQYSGDGRSTETQ